MALPVYGTEGLVSLSKGERLCLAQTKHVWHISRKNISQNTILKFYVYARIGHASNPPNFIKPL